MLKASDEKRIRYLRKLGVKIGERCRIRTMSFSTEPYLIEIGNHTAVAAGRNSLPMMVLPGYLKMMLKEEEYLAKL